MCAGPILSTAFGVPVSNICGHKHALSPCAPRYISDSPTSFCSCGSVVEISGLLGPIPRDHFFLYRANRIRRKREIERITYDCARSVRGRPSTSQLINGAVNPLSSLPAHTRTCVLSISKLRTGGSVDSDRLGSVEDGMVVLMMCNAHTHTIASVPISDCSVEKRSAPHTLQV
jgi:hypothetical protein